MLKEKKKVKLPDEIENLFRCICYFILYQVIFRSSQFNGLCPRWKDQWGRVPEGHGPLQVRSMKPSLENLNTEHYLTCLICISFDISFDWFYCPHLCRRLGQLLTISTWHSIREGHYDFTFLVHFYPKRINACNLCSHAAPIKWMNYIPTRISAHDVGLSSLEC